MCAVSVSLSHVTISSAQFAHSMAFYDAVLGALGLVRTAEFGDEEESDAVLEAAGWGDAAADPILWLVATADPATATCAAHLALRAGSRAGVEAFFAAGLAHGGRSLRAPRRWAIYRRGQFAATLLDPDGNRVEAVAAE